jgi:hypothetical protein
MDSRVLLLVLLLPSLDQEEQEEENDDDIRSRASSVSSYQSSRRDSITPEVGRFTISKKRRLRAKCPARIMLAGRTTHSRLAR